MPGAVLTAIDSDSGESFAVSEDVYRENPGAYTLAEDQVIAYDPTGGVAPVTAGLEVTPEALAGPEIGARVTAEELAAQERTRTAEELTGGVRGKVGAVARGLVSGASLGASELLFKPQSGIEAELEQMRRDTVGKYQAGAELIGEVGLTLLSGGTGAAGAVARGAAPSLIARAGARIAGTGAERTIARQVAAGAFEQAALDVSKAVAAQAMRDEPLSLSAISSTLTNSTLLGGGAAGTLGLLGRGVSRAVARPGATPAEALIGAATDPAALTRALREAEQGLITRAADDIAAPLARKPVKLGSLFSKRGKAPEVTRRAAQELVDQVGARARRATQAREAIDSVVEASRVSGQPLPDDLIARARMAIDDQEIAARAAAEHMPDIAADVERAVTGQPVAVAADALPAMRRLDVADRDLGQAIAEIRKSLPPPSAQAASAPQAQGLLSRAADALGILEIAETAGAAVPSVRRLPGIGPILSTFAQVRTLARAAGKIGLLPGSQVAEAAQLAAAAADRFRGVLDKVSRGSLVTSGALPRAVRQVTAAGARALLTDIPSADPAALPQVTAAQWSELPDDMKANLTATAARRLEYLASVAPQPPPGFESMPALWSPTPSQLQRFGETASALERPLAAVEALFKGGWRYPLEIVAGVRAVFPEVYAETQRHLLATAGQITRNNPRAVVAEWGRLFDVPFLPELQPSYSMPATPSPDLPAPGMQPASTRSPIAEAAVARPTIRRG